MRVLHVSSGNLFGGIETFLLALARLAALTPATEPEFALCFDGRLVQELQALNARTHCLGEVRTRYPWTVLRARRILRRLLKAQDYDVVVCHAAWPQAVFGPAVRSAGAPLVYFSHAPATGRHWLERWARRVVPDTVLCNSLHTQSSVASMYPGVSSEVVYLPVAAPPQFTGDERLAARSELETPAGATVIIQVSRMEAWKGHSLHLEALARLPQHFNWIAWMVGGAQRGGEMHYLAGLKEQAARLGIADRVRFTGQRSDVPRLLAAADIFCQPNLAPEPFGISLVEALYAGLPVVTTAMGGALEIVDSTCGILVSPDSAMLSDALRQLVENPEMRKGLSDQGPRRAESLCAPERQMKKLERALRSAIRREVEACGDLRPA
jgi:glycosyltransferase involved in cell wall biosynthesis